MEPSPLMGGIFHHEPPLLEFNSVSYQYRKQTRSLWPSRQRWPSVLSDISFSVRSGQSVAIVGESGSGKSTICRLAIGLARPDAGTIYLEGKDITTATRQGNREILRKLQIVFQNPVDALNPRQAVLDLVAEPLVCLGKSSWFTAREAARQVLDRVGISTELHSRTVQHISGGQAQRVNIARAIITKPKLLICDEPTSALDVSVQAQILNLLRQLANERQIGLLYVSHDLRCVSYLCDELVVLRQGKVIEKGSTRETLSAPRHEYTRDLVRAAMRLDLDCLLALPGRSSHGTVADTGSWNRGSDDR